MTRAPRSAAPSAVDEATIIARVRKNASEEVLIRLEDYYGRPCLDVRVFADYGDRGEMLPTKKGLAFSVERLPAIIEALEQARTEAVHRGVLDEISANNRAS